LRECESELDAGEFGLEDDDREDAELPVTGMTLSKYNNHRYQYDNIMQGGSKAKPNLIFLCSLASSKNDCTAAK
jgi:hypothetical protein